MDAEPRTGGSEARQAGVETIETRAGAERLTAPGDWDRYWEGVPLPREIRRTPGGLYLNAILDVFDRHLPRGEDLRALEIGGAPGQYLAYVYRTFGYEVHCLDYSQLGCEATRRNLAMLGIPGTVHEADLFDDSTPSRLPAFDVVYSLGLIEHFADLEGVVERHLAFLRPGGTLLLGVPNFQGVNGWFLRTLAPKLYAQHHIPTMNLRRWTRFERRFGLERLYRGYVGGFEPAVVRRREPGAGGRFRRRVAGALFRLLHERFAVLRRLNGRLISGYAMGVYRKPGSSTSNASPIPATPLSRSST
ncbi:MAG TPA: class I SAM-dependent methyltransferase [Candidatus Limnocylindria bacterium]|nr:class I SAM-dependent methyltransferase [Candidatus Limnocylindria bacterium]